MWIYEGKEFTNTDEWYGFVYLIENLTNGKKYIGRKYLTKAGYKTVKGKRKKIRVESDCHEQYYHEQVGCVRLFHRFLVSDSYTQQAVIVNIKSKNANALRPPTSHVCGLGVNEIKTMIAYIDAVMIAKIVRNCFMIDRFQVGSFLPV